MKHGYSNTIQKRRDGVVNGKVMDPQGQLSSFEGYPLKVRHKQDWDRGFIFLLPQAAALPESDAGSGVIKPASSFVIQNCQTSALCGARCIGHIARTWSAVAQRRHTRDSVKERDPICAWTNGSAQHQSAGG